MRPEFLNRIDEIVVFHPLGRSQIREIAEIQFERIRKLAKRSNDIDLALTDAAKDFLAERGFDPVFGARPLKRVIQREVTNKLAEEVLSGWIQPGQRLRVDVSESGDGLVFESLAAQRESEPVG
jgi:ATP-dependent Clp protease ATP-binding subunit ClpB